MDTTPHCGRRLSLGGRGGLDGLPGRHPGLRRRGRHHAVAAGMRRLHTGARRGRCQDLLHVLHLDGRHRVRAQPQGERADLQQRDARGHVFLLGLRANGRSGPALVPRQRLWARGRRRFLCRAQREGGSSPRGRGGVCFLPWLAGGSARHEEERGCFLNMTLSAHHRFRSDHFGARQALRPALRRSIVTESTSRWAIRVRSLDSRAAYIMRNR